MPHVIRLFLVFKEANKDGKIMFLFYPKCVFDFQVVFMVLFTYFALPVILAGWPRKEN